MMVSSQAAGVVGLCLSGVLWSVSSWRLIFHLSGCLDREGCSTLAPSEWLTPRRVFHSLLWVAMTVESLAYADLSGGFPLSQDPIYAEKWGHVLLDTIGRAMFEFMAFSLVTVLWFRTAAEARAVSTAERSVVLDGFPRLLVSCCVLLNFCSLWEAIDLLSRDSDLLTYQSYSWVYRIHLFVESLSWAVHTLLVVTCVSITARSILQLSAFPQTGAFTRAALLLKPLLPMALCGVFYTTRSLWLMVKLVRLLYTGRVKGFDAAWWIGFVWLPTIFPSAMVLYSARKRDQTPVSESEEILLPTPVPPAEAFMAFRRVSNGIDGSPLAPRCITAETPEAVYMNLADSDEESDQA